jgi:hypothetical protein
MSDWINNPLTNRYIKKGSKTYKTLLKSGIIKEEPEEEEEDNYKYSEEEEEEEDSYDYSPEESKEEYYEDEEENDKQENGKIKNLPNDEEIDEMTEEELQKLYSMLSNFRK